jgi:hypothetical protein
LQQWFFFHISAPTAGFKWFSIFPKCCVKMFPFLQIPYWFDWDSVVKEYAAADDQRDAETYEPPTGDDIERDA